MIFDGLPLDGAYSIDLDRHLDERGSFSRIFCESEFAAVGLPVRFPQANISTNVHAGTLRGLHYNRGDDAEAKVVRCIRGALFDVIVDLREGSPTRLQWFGAELSADNGRALFVPAGFAHGFVTLQPTTDVLYLMSESYRPDAARGIRWDDAAVAVQWPVPPVVISERDATYPAIDPATFSSAT